MLSENSPPAVIGANALLCRVGSLYHDIGKINNPQYFTEKSGWPGFNPHTLLQSKRKRKNHYPTCRRRKKHGHKNLGCLLLLRDFIETHHRKNTNGSFFIRRGATKVGDPDNVEEFHIRRPTPYN